MKKIALFCSLFLLLALCSCQKEGASSVSVDLEALVQQITADEVMPNRFTVADEDYIQTAFEGLPLPSAAKICFFDPDEGCSELGVFCFESETDASKALQVLQTYLDDATSSREATAMLYPSESLTREIDQFKNATVSKKGLLVYYLAMENAQAEAASTVIAAHLQ